MVTVLFGRFLPDLNKRYPALTDVTADVSDRDLSVVLNPARSAEKVVNTGRHVAPFIVVSESKAEMSYIKHILGCALHECVRSTSRSPRQQEPTSVAAGEWYRWGRSPLISPKTCSYTSGLQK